MESIEKIGIEKVAGLGIKRGRLRVSSTRPETAKLKDYRKFGRYWVYKRTDTPAKAEGLKKIAEQIGWGIKVDLEEK